MFDYQKITVTVLNSVRYQVHFSFYQHETGTGAVELSTYQVQFATISVKMTIQISVQLWKKHTLTFLITVDF